MSILYKEEHIVCKNYQELEQIVFKQTKFSNGFCLEETDIPYTMLVFVVKGKIHITLNTHYLKEMGRDTFTIIPANNNYSIKAMEQSEIVCCNLGRSIDFEKCFFFSILKPLCVNKAYEFNSLPSNQLINRLIDTILLYLNDELYCKSFHLLKRDELLILLRVCYSSEQLAQLFYPLLNSDLEFEFSILRNYRKVNNVKELASICNYSLSTFKRRFSKHFAQPPHQWMLQKKAKEIYNEVRLTNKSYKEISFQYDFSSQTDFNRFIKKQFGKTPSEIRMHSNK